MKVLGLDLAAFGPFTNLRLDFQEAGLHILYGPNEVGKSSALRALKAWLFGVPHNSPDDFLHGNPSLRVGGRLRHSDGSELAFFRRKGHKATLLDLDGKPLDDVVLAKFLGSVGEEIFSTVFAIDHAELVRGGQEILQGRGEVGQALFAAGMGGVGLQQTLQDLEEEATLLFRPRGQTQAINKSLARHNELKRTIAEVSLSGRQWSEHKEALDKAIAERNDIREGLRRLMHEKTRFERLQTVLPKIAKRRELLAKLQALGNVVDLPSGFADARREADRRLETAVESKKQATMDMDHLKKRIQVLTAPGPIVDQADAIIELHEGLGSHRKAAGDLSKLQGSLQQIKVDVETLRKELRPDTTLEQIEALRLSAGQRSRIQELGAQHQVLLEATDRTHSDVETLQKDVANTKKKLETLEAPSELGELRRTVSGARKQGDLEEARRTVLGNIKAEEEQTQIELRRLGLWTGTLDDLEKLPIPPLETVERYESELRDLIAKKTQLEESIEERKTKISQIDLELEELRLAGTVPTEEELLKARERRDQGWKLVRRAWLNTEDITKEKIAYDANVDLPEAYEKNVTRSDEIADRLRREADRVARYAALLAQRAEYAKELDRPTEEQADTHNQIQHFQQQWVDLWQAFGVTPLPPREMRSWVIQQHKLAQRAETLRGLHREARLLKERIDGHRVELDRILEGIGEKKAAPDESLDAMLLRCETVIQKVEELARRKAELESKAAKLQDDLEVARRNMAGSVAKLEQWGEHWAKAVGVLGLRPHTSPTAVFAILNKFDAFVNKLDEGNSLERRIDSINRDAKAFEVTVNALVRSIAPDLGELSFDQAADQLNARLGKAQAESARLAELQKQVDEKERALREAQDVIQIMSEKLDGLCHQAKCSQPIELPLIEERFKQAKGLRNEMEVLGESLIELGGGLELDKLIQEAAQVNADELPAHISEVSLKIDELEGRRTQLDQEIGGERTRLEQMDGNAKAAEAAEQAQGILAEMHRGVERYIRLRLASTILRQEIERYRAEKQEVLLRRTSELFTQITLGSFSELQVGFSEKDEPVLIGLRPSGERIGVEGMSDGTRDQLYLCLRLAHIERYLEVNEPTPFIVDDILIKFDDKRAEASLKVLADLSTKTQVIFFTHHSRLVELANAIADGGAMRVHYLNPEPAVLPTKSRKVISVARTPTQ